MSGAASCKTVALSFAGFLTLSDIFFEYELPTELIAQHPAQQREDSRLMV
ncbi:hypothetical protein EBX93_14725, partial [bacterium]|nr:hypothetical protein [bacterium]